MTSHRTVRRLAALVVVVLTVVLAACSGGAEETTTTAPVTTTTETPRDQPIVFGSGVMPSTVPADFPMPEQARIGSTLVDWTRGITELVTTYPANVAAVKEFYDTNLAALGYNVDDSSGTDGAWTIVFSGEELSGEINIATAGSGLSQATIRITTPVEG